MDRRPLLAMVLLLVGCSGGAPDARQPSATATHAVATSSGMTTRARTSSSDAPTATASTTNLPPLQGFTSAAKATFDEPWAMTFLPDGRALVTERGGVLRLVDVGTGQSSVVQGTPEVAVAGQGGLGDVIVSPSFAQDRVVYLSWAERGDGGSGAAVGRATLSTDGSRLEGLRVIWRQSPKVQGDGHFGHRLAIHDGHLYVSSGERQKFTPAQDRTMTLGKIMRMGLDGSDPQQVSLGHRNPLGIAFDADGRLWESEMGPKGGDEINLIRQGANYGWPQASNGSHYSGEDIPDHRAGDGFEAPKVWWNPSISPGSLMVYSGALFPEWRGDAFVGALSGQALIRVHLDGEAATKADQWDMGARIREVEQGPDGAIWLLEDGAGGRLLRLDPRR